MNRDLDNYLARNAAAIEREAIEYAQNYDCGIYFARRDVRDEYKAAYYAEREERGYDIERAIGGAAYYDVMGYNDGPDY